jgi:hypothetical protein
VNYSSSFSQKFLSAAESVLALEGKGNLLRLPPEIRITQAETNAANDGVNAFEKLLAGLRDLPTLRPVLLPGSLRADSLEIEPAKESRE